MRRSFQHILFVLLLSSCGGVQAGNPVGPGRYSLTGTVLSLEGNDPLQRTVRVVGNGLDRKTASDADGAYRITDLESGTYSMSVDGKHTETVVVEEDTVKNVVLPVPAAPKNFRFVEIGVLNGLCLLWDDVSGVEAGMRIDGPLPFEIHTNYEGLRQSIEIGDPQVREGLETRAAAAWNESVPGTYVLTAYNEFGDSAPVYLEIYGYAVSDVPLFERDPYEPTVDEQRCLETAADANPRFLESR